MEAGKLSGKVDNTSLSALSPPADDANATISNAAAGMWTLTGCSLSLVTLIPAL